MASLVGQETIALRCDICGGTHEVPCAQKYKICGCGETLSVEFDKTSQFKSRLFKEEKS